MAERLRVLGVFIEVMGVNEKTKMALLKLHTYLSTAIVVQFFNHL